MGAPVLVAQLRVTNALGAFDSLNPAPFAVQPRISFTVKHSLSSAANTASISIYNLAPDTIAKVTGTVTRRYDWTPAERAELLAAGASAAPFEVTADGFGMGAIELSWGYADSETMDIVSALSVGFVGQSLRMSAPPGLDRVLTIEAEDGSQSLGAAEVVQLAGAGAVAYQAKSYKAGTDVVDIIVDLINALGLSVDRGELSNAIQAAMAERGLPLAETKIIGGYNSSGSARAQLEAFLSALALRWSIQDGAFILLSRSGLIPGFPPFQLSTLAANIVGQPKIGEAGKLSITTWATTAAKPGRQVDVLTETIAAGYRVDESTTTGDTYSGGSTVLALDELQTLAGI